MLFIALSFQNSLERAAAEDAQGLGGNADLLVIPVLRNGFSVADRRLVERTDAVQAAVPVVRAAVTGKLGEGPRRILLFGIPHRLTSLFPSGLGVAGRQMSQLRQGTALTGPAVGMQSGEDPFLAFGQGRSLDARELAATPFQRLNGGLFALVTIPQLKELVPRRSWTELLYVKATPGASRGALKNELELGLAGHGLVTAPATIARLYQEPIKALALFIEFGALASLPILLLVVSIVSSRAIAERQRELALLATLGASRLQLGATLLCSTAALGCMGGVAGIWLGMAAGSFILRRAAASYPLLPETGGLSLVTSASDVFAVLTVTIGIAMAAALLPIRRGVSSRIAAAANPASSELNPPGLENQGRLRLLIVGWFLCAITIVLLLALGTPVEGFRLALVVGLGAAMAFSVLPLLARVGVGAAIALFRRRSTGLSYLAARNLQRQRSRTTAMVGALGFAAAIALGMGFSLSAVESRVTQVFEDRYGPPLYLTADSFAGLTSDHPLSGRWTEALKGVPGVKDVFPFRIRVLPSDNRLMVVVSAPMIREIKAGFSNAVVDTEGRHGAILRGLRRGGAVVSRWTFQAHHLRLGERLALGGPAAAAAPPVVGIYEDILGADALYMERSTYIHLSGDESVDRFAIAPTPGTPLSVLRARLRSFVARYRIPAVVEGRDQVINSVLEAPRRAFAFGWALVGALFLIAGLIVFNAMLTATRERRWEFSLCRAIGMTRGQMVQEFVLQCLIVGMTAALFAAAVGVAVAALLIGLIRARLGLNIGLDLEWQALVAVTLGSLLVVICAAIMPVTLAARKEILPAIREI